MGDIIEIGAHFSADERVLARHELYIPPRLPPGPDGLSFALLQSTRAELLDGHRVELVENGRVFDVLVEQIRRARRSIHILIFVWRPCRPSDRVVEAVIERARAGVRCRVVVDPWGSDELLGDRDFDEHVERRLVEAGCEVHYYRLLTRRVRERVLGRDHQKLVVIDGRVGLTGGFGIWRVWEGNGLRSGEWRDVNVLVEGPAVRSMQMSFARSWQESGGNLLPQEAFPDIPQVGSARATYVSSSGRLGVSDAERLYRLVVAAARKRLWLTNAYFTPPDGLLALLEEKRRQGVDVRILTTGPFTDQPVVRAAQRATYARLLRAGVRVWEYQPSMMHSKTAVVDDWLGVVGSINLDPLSLNKLSEGALVVTSLDLNARLAAAFERDLTHSTEITGGRGARSTLWRRLARRVILRMGKNR